MPHLTSATAVSDHSVGQVHDSYCHSILASHWRHPLSLVSTPWHHRLQLESWGTLFFPVVTLALLPSFSSLPQPQWWCSDLPAWFSSKLVSVWISQPNWTGLLSQNQFFLPCNRKASGSWSAYQRTGWPPLETRPWLRLSGLPARPPGVCWRSNILPTHGMVGVDCLLCLPALLSPVHNSIFCLQE